MSDASNTAFGREYVIGRKELKPFVKRTNWHGLVNLAGHFAVLVATGYLVYLSLGTWWIVPAMVAHGFVMAFLFAPVHECSHGTPFRSRWLNEAVYWVIAPFYGVPPIFFRYSHAAHHTYTQVRGWDPAMVLPRQATLWDYIYSVSAIPFWFRNGCWLCRHALIGSVHPSERYFVPEGETSRIVLEARIILAVYAGIAVAAFAIGTWAPLTYWVIPRLVGEPFMRWIRIARHAECEESGDLRRNTRTTKAPAWLNFLFWNMPYHAEHHLCPMVPFHALPQLHEKVGHELQSSEEGYFQVHADVLRNLRRHEGVTWTEQSATN